MRCGHEHRARASSSTSTARARDGHAIGAWAQRTPTRIRIPALRAKAKRAGYRGAGRCAGTIENMRDVAAASLAATVIVGPSSGGGKIIGGQRRRRPWGARGARGMWNETLAL